MQSRILENLNPPQREAVEVLEGPLLILAGAGSGKTRVVTRRIANLIAHGVRPWQILAITFTNKAAEEMRRRVDDLLGTQSAANVWLSTFHSFCARVLRRDGEVLGYSRDFTIYDEDDAQTLLKDILRRLSLSDDKRFSPRNVRQSISNFKNQACSAEDLEEGQYHDRILKQIFMEYEKELKKNQALDFDDLLRQAVVLFRDHPDVLERYQERFRHVLVDEYQDTNGCQYLLVKLLAQKHRNVCATGDPDQSIYAWRGADVRNILTFEKDFPEAKVVKLEQNYRSTQRILDAASAVIANNVERKKKSLWTENSGGELVSFSLTETEQHESIEIAQHIEKHVRDGARYSDIAVFYRTNAQSRAIEEALRNNIPYQIVGGITFYERREVKDALAYLRLLVNPKDDISFRRVINVPRRALGDSAIEALEQQAARTGKALLETLEGPEADAFIATFKPKPRQGLIQFARTLDKLRALPPYPVAPILQVMLEETGLLRSLEEAGEKERVDNLDSLVNAAAEFDNENDPEAAVPDGPPPEPGAFDGLEDLTKKQASLAGFLEKVALLAPTDDYDTGDDRVTLMTLHMAKGLEFPVVFIAGLEDGLLPLLRGDEKFEPGENSKAIEEERRLMYVGMTRAKECLYLLRARYRRRFGKSELTMPSRFLNEVPDKLLKTRSGQSSRSEFGFDVAQPPRLGAQAGAPVPRGDAKKAVFQRDPDDEAFAAFEREVSTVFSDELQPRRPSSRRRDPALQTVVDRLLDTSDSQENPALLEIGDRVRHAKFGLGTVESITGTGVSMKVKVHFREHGPKQLLLSMAKLEKL